MTPRIDPSLAVLRLACCGVAAILSPALSTIAQAQSLHVEGEAAISLTGAAPDGVIGSLDVTLALPLGHPLGRPLSLELGTVAFVFPDKRPHETYVAFGWDDRLRIGVVRPAYDAVLPSVFRQAAPFLAYDRAEYASALTTTEAMRRTAVPWGARWNAAHGNLDWTLSAHDAVRGGFRSASAALRWERGAWSAAAAAEGVWDRKGNWRGLNAKLGLRRDTQTWGAGFAYLHPEASARHDALALDLWTRPWDRWTLSAFGEITRDGDDAGGIAARLDLGATADLTLSTTTSQTGEALHMTLARRF